MMDKIARIQAEIQEAESRREGFEAKASAVSTEIDQLMGDLYAAYAEVMLGEPSEEARYSYHDSKTASPIRDGLTYAEAKALIESQCHYADHVGYTLTLDGVRIQTSFHDDMMLSFWVERDT